MSEAPLELSDDMRVASLLGGAAVPTSSPPGPPPRPVGLPGAGRRVLLHTVRNGWILAVDDAPLMVARTPEELGEVVTTWARGG